ncbi:conserved hypothetical protein [Neospora caninum Liverpool]|uniref:Uncharacterized protein n=1 Tax=Neospora caninum (strain Liverpool) TaxID=572307 RepID=F0VBA3_NEOCL|nr:conserved hypothetical protein [Neospora caninum Liverpool]CBZ50887.1 conserved hypothetical protein [Neospora caninum Liverpool]CEL68189.1 TPA: hypothetical protein BN1204_039620 [Neospora caninum Liverpool]|eukprot:XP_003880920.1 conserved hypothetical protein [Neospora caninum Liverpool]
MATPYPPQYAYPAAESEAWGDAQRGYAQMQNEGYYQQQYAGQESWQTGYYGQDGQAAQNFSQPAMEQETLNQDQLRQQYEQMQQEYEQQCAQQAWSEQSGEAPEEMSPLSNSVYLPQPAMFGHMTKPIPQARFHAGYHYAPGISVHYNYYEAAEYTARLEKDRQEAAEKQDEKEGEKGDRKESTEKQEEQALKPLITSKHRLSSGQAYVN